MNTPIQQLNDARVGSPFRAPTTASWRRSSNRSRPRVEIIAAASSLGDGQPWLSVSTSNLLYELTIDGSVVLATPFGHPAIVDPTSIAFDDRGHLLVSSGGEVLDFQYGSAGWAPAANSLYADLEVDDTFLVARSRTNFDPELHDGPSWEDLDPAEVEGDGQSVQECLGDFNLDLVVGLGDPAILSSAWGGPHALADFNADQVVGPPDLVNLLSAWGPRQDK